MHAHAAVVVAVADQAWVAHPEVAEQPQDVVDVDHLVAVHVAVASGADHVAVMHHAEAVAEAGA